MHGSMGSREGFQSIAKDWWALKPSRLFFFLLATGEFLAVQVGCGSAAIQDGQSCGEDTVLWGCDSMNLA